MIVNRYDGVDLPDDACRILVLDARPSANTLWERYTETVRPTSEVIAQRTARIIEQGLGRSVPGEKDFCAVVLLGSDLVQAVRNPEYRKFYSAQTRTQIEIGIEIAEYARDDIADGIEAEVALVGLIKKLLDRDDGWKEFYSERMELVTPEKIDKKLLEVYAIELRVEQHADAGQHDDAAKGLQELIDSGKIAGDERGWYLRGARQTYIPLQQGRGSEAAGRCTQGERISVETQGRNGGETVGGARQACSSNCGLG